MRGSQNEKELPLFVVCVSVAPCGDVGLCSKLARFGNPFAHSVSGNSFSEMGQTSD